ncbi:hypothetical protein [Serratia fonticola]|uniref:hypothetical protein n=1 Tax=Serratia fonticola TaxID=47917 RepID=UPI0027EC0911|nr:hypothetical protein [Serratia fonticola]MDQ7207396.1 hypothetical protein [Serratia fonticola]HBE9077630.1 hypothetical protein [Serratia fonticola]HBE9088201.1 hypothetical protein [Serratia fonticola]HBE9150359.1 hypothetical protein [Serratia fonticola]
MDLSTVLKIAGAVFTASGSILLAWRAYRITKLIKLVLDAHEISFQALVEVIESGKNTTPFLINSVKHHDDYVKGAGIKLVIAGFAGLALGAVFNAASYFI